MSRGMFEMMIGSRNTTPPRMLRIVPFGETHIFLRSNSLTRASSGVMAATFQDHSVFLDGVRGIDRHLIIGRVAVLDASGCSSPTLHVQRAQPS